MTDRERIIKGLECCLGANDCNIEPEEDCPYKEMCLCAMALRLDILALLKEQEEQIKNHDKSLEKAREEIKWLRGMLKEQEAKTVSHIRTVAYRTIGYCPSCGRGLDSYEDGNSGDHITHFCYNCGQAVKWDD